MLESSGLSARVCTDARDLARRLRQPCGAVIIAEEAFKGDVVEILHAAINRQEKWSDLPIILLTGPDPVLSQELFSKSGNISLLERPFSRFTLVQTVEVAIRSRKRQYQIRDLLTDLKRSRDEADRANTAKSQFLANMSHELRTPLNAIIGFCDLLDDPRLTRQECLEFTATVRRNGQLLTQLIDDILDLSKVESGRFTTEQEKCHLPTIIIEVKAILDKQARDKDIALTFSSKASVPEFITTDPMRLKQILLNVIGNAIKFTSKGSVDVVVQELNESAGKKSTLAFVVKDTGLGISLEQQGKLFSPFTQADPSITRTYGGTGLGLVLSRRLAEILGGAVELTHSALGEGSIFTVLIDPGFTEGRAFIGSGQQYLTESDLRNQREILLNGLSVLVAEDSPDNRMLIELLLKREGADVDFAADGVEAYEKAQTKDYDVVLMDLQMPRLDGLQATAKLRAGGYRKPIIAITAHAMKEERDKAIQAGCTDHMSKPLNFNELIRKVKTHNTNLLYSEFT